ncbi:MAG: trehalase family glycosidase [Vampirovibrionales bacterium]
MVAIHPLTTTTSFLPVALSAPRQASPRQVPEAPAYPVVYRAEAVANQAFLAQPTIQALGRYAQTHWGPLTRSLKDLPVSLPDSKVLHGAGQPYPLYIAPTENPARVWSILQQQLPAAQLSKIRLAVLPPAALNNPAAVPEPGLLFVPHPYVVPGGRFNELYGWDSYFIQLGLLESGQLGLAKALADNFVYEVAHYGKILNANRSYYLGRSQPPFLTDMVLNVYRQTGDKQWLASTLPAIEKQYQYWTSGQHLITAGPAAGLSRYAANGQGPAPEVLAGERDAQGLNHYDRIKAYFRSHPVADYEVRSYYDRATDSLTPLFYQADRTMRESGFDPSNRFGPFNADILNYAPVCLNTLLWRMEAQTAQIYTELGRGQLAQRWQAQAQKRAVTMAQTMWDEASGLFLDYNVQRNQRRFYPFATSYMPLWAGLASVHQARALRNNLGRFETPGGLQTSQYQSGNQWDAPFGWAPMQLMAVEGLRQYGYRQDADRLSMKFLAMVGRDLARTGTLVEKYDVQRGTSDLAGQLQYGYKTNEIGFGWTNGVVLALMRGLQS